MTPLRILVPLPGGGGDHRRLVSGSDETRSKCNNSKVFSLEVSLVWLLLKCITLLFLESSAFSDSCPVGRIDVEIILPRQ